MALVVETKKSSAASVFQMGKLRVETHSSSSPPKPVLIVRPTEAGEYPVILFFHGFFLVNNNYTQLFKHVASHGYIVVAPQLYNHLDVVTHSNEIKKGMAIDLDAAASIINWLSEGLQSLLPQGMQANLGKLALAGHSRGGAAAFAVALHKDVELKTPLKFSVLMGIDPVAGQRKEEQLTPHVLTYVPQSLDINVPLLLVGTGLGDKPILPLFPSCAPDGLNHKEFFNESQPPCCYFVAKEYGHLDMLDDDTLWSYFLCSSGKEKKLMREFVGGAIVAFLEKYVDNNPGDLQAIVNDPKAASAPVEVDPHVSI